MNPEVLERVLRCPMLPSLPAVAVKVLEITRDENASLDGLAQVIQNDQALAARVLKTVNSSFYGLRKPCASISQAVVLLGLSAVKALALGFSLVSAVGEVDDEFDHVAYWRRGIYTAVAARMIAKQAHLPFQEEAFLAGLLQDIGMMAMYQGIGQGYIRVVLAAGHHRDLVRQELAALELQHPDLGAMMAERWRLPPMLVMPVKYHERPTAAPAEYGAISRCVALGNTAHDVLTDEEPRGAMARFQECARKWFDFDPQACRALLLKIALGTEELAGLFRVDTGEFPEAAEVVDRAQEQLAEIAEEVYREAVAKRPELETVLSDAEEFDPMTGVLAPRAGEALAEGDFKAAREAGQALSVIRVRMENLGTIVERLGLEAGDAVMFETGAILQQQFEHKGGRVMKWEEAGFEVVMRGLDRGGAERAAGEVRELVVRASVRWRLPGIEALPPAMTLGVATMEAGANGIARVQQLREAAGCGGREPLAEAA